jgi:hypothetical protein
MRIDQIDIPRPHDTQAAPDAAEHRLKRRQAVEDEAADRIAVRGGVDADGKEQERDEQQAAGGEQNAVAPNELHH